MKKHQETNENILQMEAFLMLKTVSYLNYKIQVKKGPQIWM